MKYVPLSPARPTPSQTLNQNLLGDVYIGHMPNRVMQLCEDRIQGFSLCSSAWESIQQRTLLTVRASQALSDHCNRNIIRDQFALVDVLGSQFSKLCLTL
jgi:hypothetical protein